MRLLDFLKTGSRKNKAAAFFVVVWASTAAMPVEGMTVTAVLRDRTVTASADGIPEERAMRNLEDGLRTALRFEVQVLVPGKWRRKPVYQTEVGKTARLDPFDGRVVLQSASDGLVRYSRETWFRHFRMADIPMQEDIPPDAEVRVRAVWDPVLLIPGLRFLRVFIPGFRETGDWVYAVREDRDSG